MKKLLLIAASAAFLAGCQSDSQRDRALVGGGLGAATGAVIGAAAGNGVGPALAGAAIGNCISRKDVSAKALDATYTKALSRGRDSSGF